MINWGIQALNHGSSIAVIKRDKYIHFVSDQDSLPSEFIRHALEYEGAPDRIYWYENPWLKKARQLQAKQYSTAFDFNNLPSRYLRQAGLGYAPITYTQHHASHAAAGYYTSPFNHCAIVVVDAIGEFETATIWEGKQGQMKKLWSARYPHSLGLFYSAFTKFFGLTPIRDEALLEQMASQGNPERFRSSVDLYVNKNRIMDFTYNFHRGVLNWSPENMTVQEQCDLAAAVQEEFERQIKMIMARAKALTGADSLVYMGGCAMNRTANSKQVSNFFKYVWSLPNPGDASSSLGAVLYHTRNKIQWQGQLAEHITISV
jgi:carbamoyltransferase